MDTSTRVVTFVFSVVLVLKLGSRGQIITPDTQCVDDNEPKGISHSILTVPYQAPAHFAPLNMMVANVGRAAIILWGFD